MSSPKDAAARAWQSVEMWHGGPNRAQAIREAVRAEFNVMIREYVANKTVPSERPRPAKESHDG